LGYYHTDLVLGFRQGRRRKYDEDGTK